MRNPETESKRWIEQARYELKTAEWNAKAYLYSQGERLVLDLVSKKLIQ